MMRLEFRRPRKAKFVVLGGASQGILPLLKPGSYSILDYRGSSINVLVLLHMLSLFRCSWRAYCLSLLSLTQAKVVLTCIDTDAIFYSFKADLPDVTFIAIQNGIRGNITEVPGGDLWTQLEHLPKQPPWVDVVATFGPAHSAQYRSRIRCETIEVGSSRNNQFTITCLPTHRDVIRVGFISNFIPPHCKVYGEVETSPISTFLGFRPILAHEYFRAEVVVGRTVANICDHLGWSLHVAGKRGPEFPEEREMWRQICATKPHYFHPRNVRSSSYEILDGCDLIVTIDSTLGYEMIARGKRVLFVAERARILGGEEAKQFAFGFPNEYPVEGKFWTQSAEERHLSYLMQELLEMTDDEWKNCSQFVRNDLMVFDPGNRTLAELMHRLSEN